MNFNLKRGRRPQDTLPFKNHRMVQKAKDFFFFSPGLWRWKELTFFQVLSQFSDLWLIGLFTGQL